MDIEQLYLDYSVDFKTEGHKHCRPGWVNTPCPFCTGNPGYHLGYNLEGNFYYCWRCGWKPIVKSVSELLHLPEKETSFIVRKYGILIPRIIKDGTPKKIVKEHHLPSGTGPLAENHIKYLESRGFDPEELVRNWALVGTGPFSKLDDLDYKHRIVIPIIWDDEEVSFQTRDITNKHMAKYLACPQEREIINHKRIIYGKQEKWKDIGIGVEGVTDVWKLGFDSFCTFGIKYTPAQLRVIAKAFKRVIILYDNENQAQIQAKALAADLRFRGVNSYTITVESDPGAMSVEDARYLAKQLVTKSF